MKWCAEIGKTIHAVERGEKTIEDFNTLVSKIIEHPSDENDMEVLTAAVLCATYEATYLENAYNREHAIVMYRFLYNRYIEKALDALQNNTYIFPTTDSVRLWDKILSNN